MSDLLAQAIDRVRPLLADGSTKDRVQLLWFSKSIA